jgi:hypothetical protein
MDAVVIVGERQCRQYALVANMQVVLGATKNEPHGKNKNK